MCEEKMKNKMILAFGLCATLALSGCGKEEKEASSEAQNPEVSSLTAETDVSHTTPENSPAAEPALPSSEEAAPAPAVEASTPPPPAAAEEEAAPEAPVPAPSEEGAQS
jgi:outer membrane murein-binding lipoprotein Lpp